jgi:hypothetical protein
MSKIVRFCCESCGAKSDISGFDWEHWHTVRRPYDSVRVCAACFSKISVPLEPSLETRRLLQYAEQELMEAMELNPHNDQTKENLVSVRKSMSQLNIPSDHTIYQRVTAKERAIQKAPPVIGDTAGVPTSPCQQRAHDKTWWAFWRQIGAHYLKRKKERNE